MRISLVLTLHSRATFATMIAFFFFMTISFQNNRWMHALWHFVALAPLVVYASVDLDGKYF